MAYDTELTKKAYDELCQSGLFDDGELSIAKRHIHDLMVNPFISQEHAVGITPYKAGEVLGLNGKTLQDKCRKGEIDAIKDYQGWWTIPINEIIRLRHQQLQG